MKVTFLKNNYLTIWNLLYGPSISVKMHAFKQKLWLTYRKEYKAIQSDKDEILEDFKNFIPDDNTLYALFEDTKLFQQVEKEVEQHRIKLLKSWDKLKKDVCKELENILRLDLEDYQVVVLHPGMDACLTKKDCLNVAWSKKSDMNDVLMTHLQIFYNSFKNKISYNEELDKNIALAILEMAILNETYTRLEKSNYLFGSKSLVSLKKELYPYFLMYLGCDLENTTEYMMRDNMAFDVDKYTNEVQLRKLDILEFIDFIVRNKKHILKLKKETVEVL